jgi:hypothetical protein
VATTGLPAAVAAQSGDAARSGTGGLTGQTRTVTFRDASVTVPAGWPVREMTGKPGCVRLDRHAVYLGDPSRVTCPADLIGRVTAVHLTTRSTQGVTTPDRVVLADGSPVAVVVSAGDDEATARAIAGSVSYDGGAAEVVEPDSVGDARTLADWSAATTTASATTTTTTASATTTAASSATTASAASLRG